MPGLLGVVSVLFGSTAFDSFKESIGWLQFSADYGEHQALPNTAALLGFCVGVFVAFTFATLSTADLGLVDRIRLPNQLAHSVVPIIIGYIVAHYLSFFVSNGIATVQQLGDPLSRGWSHTSWLGGVNKCAIYNHPTTLAVIQGARRRDRARVRCRRRPRPSHPPTANAARPDRSAAVARSHGGIHRHRTLPALLVVTPAMSAARARTALVSFALGAASHKVRPWATARSHAAWSSGRNVTRSTPTV